MKNYDLDRYYTADELNEIIIHGWHSEEEYLQIVELIENCKITDEELEKLKADGYTDYLYSAPDSVYLDL